MQCVKNNETNFGKKGRMCPDMPYWQKGCSGRPIEVGGILQRSRVFAPRFLLDARLHEQKEGLGPCHVP